MTGVEQPQRGRGLRGEVTEGRSDADMSKQPLESDDDQGEEAERAAPAQAEPRTTAESGPSFAAAQPKAQDLSKEIVLALPKAAGERVTCRRISGDHYRCNWWSAQGTSEYDNPSMHGLMVTTHRVSRSQLLHVTKTAKGL